MNDEIDKFVLVHCLCVEVSDEEANVVTLENMRHTLIIDKEGAHNNMQLANKNCYSKIESSP